MLYWSRAGVLQTPQNTSNFSWNTCKSSQNINILLLMQSMKPLLWLQYVHGVCINRFFDVCKHVLCNKTNFCFLLHQKFRVAICVNMEAQLLYTISACSFAFENGCLPSKKTALLAVVCCSLDESSSPRHIITCTRSFRAEVSYSSVVQHRCVAFTVQGSQSLCDRSFLSLTIPILASKTAGAYDGASYDLDKLVGH